MGLAVRDDELAIRVGGVVIGLLVLAVTLLVQLGGVDFRRRIEATVHFEHTGLLSSGNDVQVAGRVVGRVTSIRLLPRHLAPEGHPLHETGGVAVDVKIEDRHADMVPVNGEFFVNAKGLLGQRYLEVGPPPDERPRQRPIRDGDEVRGIDPPRLDRVMRRSFANLVNTRRFLDAVAPAGRDLVRELDALSETLAEIEPEDGAYADTRDAVDRFTAELDALLAAWNGTVPTDAARGLADRARATLAAARTTAASLQQRLDALSTDIARIRGAIPDDTRARFRRAIDTARTSIGRIDAIVAKAQALMAMVGRGQGTIGALLNDPEFADDAKQLGKFIQSHPWQLVGRPPPDRSALPSR